jgi:hypothetical protein
VNLSASCLTYLFADRAVGKLTVWKRMTESFAIKAPGSGALVHLGALEQQVLAVAVWNLVASERVAMCGREKVKKGKGMRRFGFGLKFFPLREPPCSERLETKVWLALGSEGSDLHEVVNGGSFYDRELPANGIVVFAQREATDHQLLRRAEQSKHLPMCLRWSPVSSCYRADPGALEALEEPYAAMHLSLTEWIKADPDRWRQLVDESGAAIFQGRPNTPIVDSGGGG